MDKDELKRAAELMNTRFREDPGVVLQLGSLERGELLLSLQFEGQIEAFDQHNAVRMLNGGKGLLIGFSTLELPDEKLFEVLQQSSTKLLEKITEDELEFLQTNAVIQAEIIPQNWHFKYFDGEVFHLLVIAIDKTLKGTGAFRELLAPLIQDCANKKMPIVLETFNPDNIPLYEHFGFQLMESHTSDKVDLTCFCMMGKFDEKLINPLT